ncbi:MAG: thiamine phosphate synthase [Rhizobiaceae bacterium]|nr:thiamine phosphate synthase [Rhizobiaceae bacterium]
MSAMAEPDRCRLVLIWPQAASEDAAARLGAALSGGDVASLIVPQHDRTDEDFQQLCEALLPVAQQAGVAVMVAGDSRVAGRVKADGVHVEENSAGLADAIDRFGGKMMVGAGGAKTRDDALNLGECQPDYIFFGRFGYDTKPEPHNRNLQLGKWWAEMVSIPCVVMGGSEIASLEAVAATGAEFAALCEAIFGEGRDPAAEVARANTLLDAAAPRFEDA